MPLSCVLLLRVPPLPPTVAVAAVDIPVRMDCSDLDGQLLGSFWDRQQQQPQQQQQQAPTDAACPAPPQQQQQQQQSHSGVSSSSSSPFQSQSSHLSSLNRACLPDFSDRLLVFHRGVGVATAPGLYLTQKLDMLLDYVLVEPLNRLYDSITRLMQGPQGTAAVNPAGTAAAAAAAVLREDQAGGGLQQQQDTPASPGSNGGSSDGAFGDDVRVLSRSGDLDHPAARLVVRRSLSSLMPGPQQVLARLWEPLVLQVNMHGGRTEGGRAWRAEVGGGCLL